MYRMQTAAATLLVATLLQVGSAAAQWPAQQLSNPQLGTAALSSQSYEMSPLLGASECNVPQDVFSRGGYGCHAVVWRGQSQGVSYDETRNMCYGVDPFVPFAGPNDYCLYNNEISSAVFPAGDPAGAWETHYALSAKELAVGAAMAMHRWQSPVYVALEVDGQVRSVALERVVFLVTTVTVSALASPASACAWLGFATDSNPDNVDFKCAYYEGSRLQVTTADIVYWDASGRHARSLSGEELDAAVRAYQRTYEPNGYKLPKLPYVISKP